MLKKLALAFFIVFISGFSFFVYQKYINHNFHTVDKGILYRSGQPDAARLKEYKEKYGIRSVITLRRGLHNKTWYKEEMRAVKELGLNYHEIALSSTMPAPMERMEQLAEVLRTAERPMLIHCLGGSDRTGLGVAIYRYTQKGDSPETALRKSLNIFYGHFPYLWMKTDAMSESFLRFTEKN